MFIYISIFFGWKFILFLLGLQPVSGKLSNPFVINVCADILGTDCPSGTSACYNKTDVGSIGTSTMLSFDEKENIKIIYKTEANNCSTKIIFSCSNPAKVSLFSIIFFFFNCSNPAKVSLFSIIFFFFRKFKENKNLMTY